MNWTLIVGLVGAGAWLTGLYAIVDGIRKRRAEQKVATEHAADESDRIVVQSAVDLLKPYRDEVAELRSELKTAEHTIGEMTLQLARANEQASALQSQLADAQAEVGYLRVQVKTLSQQLPDHGGPRP